MKIRNLLIQYISIFFIFTLNSFLLIENALANSLVIEVPLSKPNEIDWRQKSNISVLIVTHDPFEAMFISNKIYIMEKGGKIIQSGSPQELYNNPFNSYVAGFFGETNKFSGTVINSEVKTPIGVIKAPKELESKKVEIHVRPQAIKLSEESTPVNGISRLSFKQSSSCLLGFKPSLTRTFIDFISLKEKFNKSSRF